MSESLVGFLSDPSTLMALGAVAVGTAWYLSSGGRPSKPPLPLDNQSIEIEQGVRRSHYAKNGLITRHFEDVTTLYEGFQRGKRVSNSGPCLAERSGPTGPYEWLSYGEVEERALAFGAGLSEIGVEVGVNSYIGIYSRNNIQWVVTEQSCNSYSRVIVPLYDTLGPDAVSYILNLAEISVAVCHDSKVGLLLKQASSVTMLKTIITMGTKVSQEDQELATECGITIYTFKEIEDKGRNNPQAPIPPKPDDLCTICFTSGTTGNPKGVCLTHCNVVSMISGVFCQMNETIPVSSEDTYISYLPLAHMMERSVHVMVFMNGARIGFFQGDVKKLVGDIQELRPTLFVSVPRLLNRIYDKVIAGVSSSAVKKWLFETAMASKEAEVKQGIIRQNSIWDYLIFNKIRKSLGGRVRIIVTGSAPISSKVMMFLRCAMSCNVVEGYGQTECGAAATMTVPGDMSLGHVGAPIACNDIKLEDVKDMNYFAANNEGEVCYRGPNVFKGYLKNQEKTDEAIDKDGWLHSGDIGRWLPNGTLKIIDRKKHIFKLSQGEYIAPEKVENIYAQCKFVAQAYLYGDSLKSACVAIIVPDEEVLTEWAKETGKAGTFKELCSAEDIKKMIMTEITAIGKESGLHSFEQAKAIMLLDEPFSVDNGYLTPTFKTKRPTVKKAFMDVFVKLYSELPN